jgi:hypothetical protein
VVAIGVSPLMDPPQLDERGTIFPRLLHR